MHQKYQHDPRFERAFTFLDAALAREELAHHENTQQVKALSYLLKKICALLMHNWQG